MKSKQIEKNSMDIEDNGIEYINNKSEEKLLDYIYKNKSIRDILDACKKKIFPYEDIYWTKINDVIILRNNFGKELEIIFPNPIVVKYELIKSSANNNKIFIDQKVFSTIQINEFLKGKQFKNPIFEIENINYNYYESKFELNEINKEFTIKYIVNDYQLNQNFNVIRKDESIKREDLSIYFDEYFKYPKLLDKESSFDYYESKNRKILYNNLIRFQNNQSIYKFKITGPSNEGKSTTLLYFSRELTNIVYLNIKCLEVLYNNKEYSKYLNILMYEFGRIKFNNDKQASSFETIFNENIKEPYWTIIEKLCEHLKKENIQATIIFDQYKENYMHFSSIKKTTDFFNTKLKIIVCSSINDKDIGFEVIKTINQFKGNPSFNLENQDYYFYYSDLVDTVDFKEKYEKFNNNFYELFDYNPKYIDLLREKGYDRIKDGIIDKMRFNSKSFGVKLEVYLFNIYRNVNKDLCFNEDSSLLYMIPLKYCTLNFKGNNFEIKYRFKLIEDIVINKIKEINTEDYFEKKLYNDNEFYGKMKGDFFEFSACERLKQIKDSLFDQKILYSLNVKNIENMEFDKNNVELKEYLENNKNNVFSFEETDLDKKFEELIDKRKNNLSDIKNIEVGENEKDIIYYTQSAFDKEKEILLQKKKKRKEEEEKEEAKKKEKKEEKKDNSKIIIFI